MDTNSILEIFRQAIKGGRGPEDEAYTAGRQTQRFQDQVGAGRRPEMTEDEAYTAQRRNQQGGVDARRSFNQEQFPTGAIHGQIYTSTPEGSMISQQNNPHTRLADQFAPQQVGTKRWATRRDWNNNPHTRLDVGPEMPMMGRQISAEEFGLADQFRAEEQMRRRNRTMPGSPVNY